MSTCFLVNTLKSVDFPTFGKPTIPMDSEQLDIIYWYITVNLQFFLRTYGFIYNTSYYRLFCLKIQVLKSDYRLLSKIFYFLWFW